MDNQLQSISKIFTEKIYRIPDYQRGYAWTEKQLKDFWNDIVQLDGGKNHYVGVLTVEKVPKEKYQAWQNDEWIINSKSFEPYYIVDGQQRLTTTIILLQSITESVDINTKLNYFSINEIKQRYIFDSRDEGISRSYIFGYEKDNPSYEFLKSRIFLENSPSGYLNEETIYTQNLQAAKIFFRENLNSLSKSAIEGVFKKITQNLLFNIYTITSDIDVYIAFETMNNRGKPLSNLELLKNRLIYLSTKFKAFDSEKNQLRRNINDSWKAVYHYLGKNKENPLDDDTFLLHHFILYFGNEVFPNVNLEWGSYRSKHSQLRENYMEYLLEDKFNIKNIIGSAEKSLGVSDINKYVESLQRSVEIWYNLFNPTFCSTYSEDEKIWIEKLSRISAIHFVPLLVVVYLQKPKKSDLIEMLKSLEKFGFIISLTSYRGVAKLIDLTMLAHNLSSGKLSITEVNQALQKRIDQLNGDDLINTALYKFKNNGFYEWAGIRYFLFEYDQNLKADTKTYTNKINWVEFKNEQEDYITVEHIFPQNYDKDCWKGRFSKYSRKQCNVLANSLGNLLPLSKPKNSSLQNKCFPDKKDNEENKVGYRFGSLSENEISKFDDWTALDILNRGLHLLDFMHKRWGVNLGNEAKKIEFLGLNFLKSKSQPLLFPDDNIQNETLNGEVDPDSDEAEPE